VEDADELAKFLAEYMRGTAAKAVQPQAQEADPNAPWLTKAHMLCTDHGVPQGNIEWRLDVLRELCPTQPQAQDKPCKPSDNA
jgi:hypothetical protein